MAIFALLIVNQVHRSLDEHAAYFNHATARLAGRVVQERFQGSAHYVESFAGRRSLQRAVSAGDRSAVVAQLQEMVAGHPGLDRAVVTDSEGRLMGDFPVQPAMRNHDCSFRDWYQGARRARATYISGMYLRSAAPQRHTMAIATPIFDQARQVRGYLVAQHTVETLAAWLNALSPSTNGHVLLADPHGQLALTPTGPVRSLATLEGHALGERLARGQHGSVQMNDPLLNEQSLIETVGTPAGWSVIVSQPVRDIHALLRTLNRTVAWLAVVFAGGMATMGLAWLRIVRRYHSDREAAAYELQQRAAALEVANEELRRADRYKDEFLSVVSHELRTPINGVTGFASILEDEISGPLNPDQHQQVQKILESGDRMLGLVNNLLEMSRIQAGAFHLSPSWVAFGSVVEEVCETLQPHAVAEGVQLECRVEVEAERCLDGDRMRLVLTNLVDNALKFTPAGGRVRVSARIVEDALFCEVSDTGVGLHPGDTERIFERFRQVDMSATRQAGGTGLGLSIVKAIVEAHGGRIGVRSVPGRGATFWFSIPPLAGCPEL